MKGRDEIKDIRYISCEDNVDYIHKNCFLKDYHQKSHMRIVEFINFWRFNMEKVSYEEMERKDLKIEIMESLGMLDGENMMIREAETWEAKNGEKAFCEIEHSEMNCFIIPKWHTLDDFLKEFGEE